MLIKTLRIIIPNGLDSNVYQIPTGTLDITWIPQRLGSPYTMYPILSGTELVLGSGLVEFVPGGLSSTGITTTRDSPIYTKGVSISVVAFSPGQDVTLLALCRISNESVSIS